LSAAKARNKPEVKPELLVTSMVALFVFGLVAITFLIFMMKEAAGFAPPFLLLFTTFSFGLMFAVEAVLMWLLLKGKRGTDTESAPKLETNELEGSNARALPEPMPSVTEHTTRAFDPVYHRRKSN